MTKLQRLASWRQLSWEVFDNDSFLSSIITSFGKKYRCEEIPIRVNHRVSVSFHNPDKDEAEETKFLKLSFRNSEEEVKKLKLDEFEKEKS